MSSDPLSVQVSFRVKKPKGVEISRKALNEIYLQWVEDGILPPNIEIRGIFWKNSARHGKLNHWRYSAYSDQSVIAKGLTVQGKFIPYKQLTPKQKETARERFQLEHSPRGDHEEARTTLQNALRTFRPF